MKQENNMEKTISENIEKTLKQRFAKDMRIPIDIFDEPYFSYRLALYESLYPHIREKYQRFCNMVADFDKPESHWANYLEYYNSVKDNLITSIQGSSGYAYFQDEDLTEYAERRTFKRQTLPTKSIIKESLDKHLLLSIDLKQANFQALQKHGFEIHDTSMFAGATSWEDFVRKFTIYDHIIESKYIREATMGACCPNRQIVFEKYLMFKILSLLAERAEKLMPSKNITDYIVSFQHDEIVFDITYAQWLNMEKDCKRVLNIIAETLRGYDIHIELFNLYYIKEIDGYIEIGVNETNESFLKTKAVSNFMLPVLIKALKQEATEDNDLVFIHPNCKYTAKFIEVPKITLPKPVIEYTEKHIQ